MTKENFPQEFLRGLSSKDFIKNGIVVAAAFQFDSAQRSDNMNEASINWLDDDGAIETALTQRKDNGKIQFSAGVARLDLTRLKGVFQCIPSGIFEYERAPLPKNPYHGNLLISSDADKQTKQLITNGLALVAGNNIIQPKEQIE